MPVFVYGMVGDTNYAFVNDHSGAKEEGITKDEIVARIGTELDAGRFIMLSRVGDTINPIGLPGMQMDEIEPIENQLRDLGYEQDEDGFWSRPTPELQE